MGGQEDGSVAGREVLEDQEFLGEVFYDRAKMNRWVTPAAYGIWSLWPRADLQPSECPGAEESTIWCTHAETVTIIPLINTSSLLSSRDCFTTVWARQRLILSLALPNQHEEEHTAKADGPIGGHTSRDCVADGCRSGH